MDFETLPRRTRQPDTGGPSPASSRWSSRLLGASTPLVTELSYDPRDPLRDHRGVPDRRRPGPAGPSARPPHRRPVRAHRRRRRARVALPRQPGPLGGHHRALQPDGEALVQARSVDITAFVDQMTAAVARGRRGFDLDVDAAIAADLRRGCLTSAPRSRREVGITPPTRNRHLSWHDDRPAPPPNTACSACPGARGAGSFPRMEASSHSPRRIQRGM